MNTLQTQTPAPHEREISYLDVFQSRLGAPNIKEQEFRSSVRRSLQLGRVHYLQAFPGPPMPYYYISMCLESLPSRQWEIDYGGGWFRRQCNYGSTVVVPPYAQCRMRGNSTGPFQFQYLAFPEKELDVLVGNEGAALKRPPVRTLNDPQLTSLMLKLWSQSREQSIGEKIVLEGTFISLIGRLLLLQDEGRQLKASHERHGNNIVSRSLDYIEANLSSKLSLVEIAGATHVSCSHLVKVFKRITNKTVYDHVLELRIQRAKELMAHYGKSLTLAEIAKQCGFASHSHLTRAFTKEVGITPQVFRNKI
ncbi:helix-turn-helix transcriptional regulator [Planctomicrobium sp. SH661]|uniref:AraC family transcriptional regulator n=1 Tax=Planctomicrobium sp. SH661 TaxID=3448124 RepID=UPI003F5AF9C1